MPCHFIRSAPVDVCKHRTLALSVALHTSLCKCICYMLTLFTISITNCRSDLKVIIPCGVYMNFNVCIHVHLEYCTYYKIKRMFILNFIHVYAFCGTMPDLKLHSI